MDKSQKDKKTNAKKKKRNTKQKVKKPPFCCDD